MSSSTIQFTHSENSTLEFCNQGMGLMRLVSLGALELTASRDFKGNCQKQYATNQAGLEQAEEFAEELSESLQSSIEIITEVSAVADFSEFEHDINTLFYLLADLSRLAQWASTTRSDLGYALSLQQAEKNPTL